MRQTIVHAFTRQQLELSGAVDEALKRAVENFDFDAEVKRVAFDVLRDSCRQAVEAAIWQAFNYQARAETIAPIVRAALREALKESE